MTDLIFQKFERSTYSWDLQVDEPGESGLTGGLPYIEMVFPKPEGYQHLAVVESNIRMYAGYSINYNDPGQQYERGIPSIGPQDPDADTFIVRFVFPNNLNSHPVVGWFKSAFYRE
jgi:hypothetical protein